MDRDDGEFLRAFEDATLPADRFHHSDHVWVAWRYLSDRPLLEALTRFTESLKRFAAAHGATGLYHETITWAYFFLIHERMAAGSEGERPATPISSPGSPRSSTPTTSPRP